MEDIDCTLHIVIYYTDLSYFFSKGSSSAAGHFSQSTEAAAQDYICCSPKQLTVISNQC